MNGSSDDYDESDALWVYVTRSVRPLEGREKPKEGEKRRNICPRGSDACETVRDIHSVRAAAPGRDVDKRTAERLRKGHMPIEARIDLHGMNQQMAHEGLRRFVLESYQAGKRTLLVITGKGARGTGKDSEKPGILRQRVPEWLEEPPFRDIVLQVRVAQPRHGGTGALYVLLRRKRAQ